MIKAMATVMVMVTVHDLCCEHKAFLFVDVEVIVFLLNLLLIFFHDVVKVLKSTCYAQENDSDP